jgi:hypothetical protein
MGNARRIGLMLVVGVGIAAVAWGQRMPQPPRMRGEFKPVVGAGAQYEMSGKNGKANWAFAVVGKESVQGQEGYWLEMRMEGGNEGAVIMKQLLVTQGGKPEIKRMIMQSPGQAPMEMPMMMMGMMKGKEKGSSEGEGMGEKVGTEPVIVPAGTFLCDHYRTTSKAGTADLWVSAKVAPYGMVKMASADMSMVLVKVLANETSHIKGEPQKMPGMGGLGGQWSDEK